MSKFIKEFLEDYITVTTEKRLANARAGFDQEINEPELFEEMIKAKGQLEKAMERLFEVDITLTEGKGLLGRYSMSFTGTVNLKGLPKLFSGIMKKAKISLSTSTGNPFSKTPDIIYLDVEDNQGRQIIGAKPVGYTRYNLKTKKWLMKKERF